MELCRNGTYETLTKEEKEMYNATLKRKWDEQAPLEFAIQGELKKELK